MGIRFRRVYNLGFSTDAMLVPLRRMHGTNGAVELLDEEEEAAGRTLRAYQDLLAGRTGAATLLERVHALEKLGVTEGTLLEKQGPHS